MLVLRDDLQGAGRYRGSARTENKYLRTKLAARPADSVQVRTYHLHDPRMRVHRVVGYRENIPSHGAQ